MKEIDILELVSSIACGGSLKEVTKEHTARIWDPRPGTQETVYNCTADVIGYGGQAGGGKTDTLFGISHYKHKKSICFRAEKSQMDNQIVARGMELFVPRFSTVGRSAQDDMAFPQRWTANTRRIKESRRFQSVSR